MGTLRRGGGGGGEGGRERMTPLGREEHITEDKKAGLLLICNTNAIIKGAVLCFYRCSWFR